MAPSNFDGEKLFEDDTEVRKLLHLWAEGIFGVEAKMEMNMGRHMFEATNKHLRRKLQVFEATLIAGARERQLCVL